MKINKAFDWHIEGEIINRQPEKVPLSDDYVNNMKNDLSHEKEMLKIKK